MRCKNYWEFDWVHGAFWISKGFYLGFWDGLNYLGDDARYDCIMEELLDFMNCITTNVLLLLYYYYYSTTTIIISPHKLLLLPPKYHA